MKRIAIATMTLIALGGCTSVNSLTSAFTSMRPDYTDLPADDMRALAAGIEKAIAEGNREVVVLSSGPLKVDDDVIQQAIRTRAARGKLVSELLDRGHAWERSNGLVAIIRTSEYKKSGTSRSRDREAVLVMGENDDRWAIYEGVLKHNNLPPSALGGIQRIFHEERLVTMAPGQKFETESGDAAAK